MTTKFLKCFSCGAVCSTPVPAETMLRGTITCPECEQKKPENWEARYEVEEANRCSCCNGEGVHRFEAGDSWRGDMRPASEVKCTECDGTGKKKA